MDLRFSLQRCVLGVRTLGMVMVWVGACGLAEAQGASTAAGQNTAPAVEKAGAAPAIQARVSLVSLDVVATDASGKPVQRLKPEDFTILENGRRMTPRSFEEHSAVQTPTDAGPAVKLPQNTFTNFADVRNDNRPLNVLLLDLMNTPVASQAVMRQQMMDYLKNLPAGTRMAVFGLGQKLVMLQGFSSDPEVLKAAVIAQGSRQSVLLRTAEDDDADNDELAMLNEDGDPTQAAITQDLANFQAEGAAMQTVIRIKDTLGALDVLARYLAGLPGRKNLIWFSGAFPASLNGLLPRGSDLGITKPFGPSVQQDFTDDVAKTSDLLAQAHVAVYPIDARGLFLTSAGMSVNTSNSSLTNPFVNGMPAAKSDTTAVPRAFEAAQIKTEKQTDEEHGTMDEMADETGGMAQYGTNDLKNAVATAIANGENYYTMTYAPANNDWNGNYRTIKVTMDRPATKLEYRHGYFAVAAKAGGTNGSGGASTTMQQAMIHGGPNATQIVFRLKVDKAAGLDDTAPKEDKLSDGRMKPPFRHYTVWYAADLRSVGFAMTPDAMYHGLVEYEAKLYDADGEVMSEVGDVAHMNLPANKYAEMLKQGLYVKQEIDAPAKGEFYLRIGVRDPLSDHVGAVEIPLSAVKAATK